MLAITASSMQWLAACVARKLSFTMCLSRISREALPRTCNITSGSWHRSWRRTSRSYWLWRIVEPLQHEGFLLTMALICQISRRTQAHSPRCNHHRRSTDSTRSHKLSLRSDSSTTVTCRPLLRPIGARLPHSRTIKIEVQYWPRVWLAQTSLFRVQATKMAASSIRWCRRDVVKVEALKWWQRSAKAPYSSHSLL